MSETARKRNMGLGASTGSGGGGAGQMGRGGGGSGNWRGGRCGPGGAGLGAAGSCVCPKCGGTYPHTPGEPCMQARCPDCGVALVREGSPHHQEILRHRSGTE